MSEENLYKQKFKVDQWPTSKVTLYPTRAAIVRQIEGVQLKVGLNEITILDLTSAADLETIRVAGTTDNHPARINDLTIDLVANTYSAADVSDSDSEDEDEEDDEPESLKSARWGVAKAQAAIKEAEERRSSALQELALVEKFASTVAAGSGARLDPQTMKDTLDLYSNQRASHFDAITAFSAQLDKLQKEQKKIAGVLAKEQKIFDKAMRSKLQARKKIQADKAERKREKDENKPEKSTKVHRVRITIELPSSDLAAHEGNSMETFQEAKLSLTYTTTSASWTPHYDLRLDTTNPSLSTLTYRAHFINRTYETWSNAALTLSTSEAAFGGLGEKIPQMLGWRVSLAKKWSTLSIVDGENGLYSLSEVKAKKEAEEKEYGHGGIVLERGFKRAGLKSSKSRSKSISFGSSKPSFLTLNALPGPESYAAPPVRAEESDDDAGSGIFDYDEDVATLAAGAQTIRHSLAGSDTYGFTTTYELPTPRTIPSSPLVRRHVIAEIPLPSLLFTHIVIPKLKAAAFLKAKVTNTSNVPLLPGQAGMTLDGSFMGNLSFPRCSPSETVVLELGVDQSVKVEYERPTVKHGIQGMLIMGKEEVGTYNRTIRITNSKPSTVSLVVLDQIPVPEDEKLKVNITVPKGLKDVNDVVKNGVGADGKTSLKGSKKQSPAVASPSKFDDISETASVKNRPFGFGKRESTLGSTPKPTEPVTLPAAVSSSGAKLGSNNWGTAKAGLKKNGEIRWDVDLYKGGCVALALEWECRVPNGDGVQALS